LLSNVELGGLLRAAGTNITNKEHHRAAVSIKHLIVILLFENRNSKLPNNLLCFIIVFYGSTLIAILTKFLLLGAEKILVGRVVLRNL
jgi:hypothetical protein